MPGKKVRSPEDTGAEARFLGGVSLRGVALPSGAPFTAIGLALGGGTSPLEVLVTSAATAPSATTLRSAWKARNAGRASPLLLVVLRGERASLCGPAGGDPPAHLALDRGQVERICREALDQPDRHAALRALRDGPPVARVGSARASQRGLPRHPRAARGRTWARRLERGRPLRPHLPQALRPSVRRALRQAWESSSVELARRQLERLAASLDAEHPGAAASLREALEETLTLLALGIGGALYRTLRSTNPIENLNGSVADYTKNMKRWRGGGMILRWVGAAVVEASKGFRKIRGHRDLNQLVLALQRHEQKQGVRTEEGAA